MSNIMFPQGTELRHACRAAASHASSSCLSLHSAIRGRGDANEAAHGVRHHRHASSNMSHLRTILLISSAVHKRGDVGEAAHGGSVGRGWNNTATHLLFLDLSQNSSWFRSAVHGRGDAGEAAHGGGVGGGGAAPAPHPALPGGHHHQWRLSAALPYRRLHRWCPSAAHHPQIRAGVFAEPHLRFGVDVVRNGGALHWIVANHLLQALSSIAVARDSLPRLHLSSGAGGPSTPERDFLPDLILVCLPPEPSVAGMGDDQRHAAHIFDAGQPGALGHRVRGALSAPLCLSSVVPFDRSHNLRRCHLPAASAGCQAFLHIGHAGQTTLVLLQPQLLLDLSVLCDNMCACAVQLPVYIPSEAEKKDARLYADNVRKSMVRLTQPALETMLLTCSNSAVY